MNKQGSLENSRRGPGSATQATTTSRRLQATALLGLILMVGPTATASASSVGMKSLRPPNGSVPAELFGLHIHRISTSTPWPAVHFSAWRLWDAQVAWPQLEPAKGNWNFATLDKYVDAAETHGVRILLPLGLSPDWASSRPTESSAYKPGNAAPPSNIDDWREYVHTVGTRYKGRIHEYEIWNEPNLKAFYSGSFDQLLELASVAHKTLKEIDPSITLVSPSATNETGLKWLESYFQAGGTRYADAIGYHFYVSPAPPEKMLPLISGVRALADRFGAAGKPIWNTEVGWAIENHQSVVQLSGGTSFNKIVLKTEDASAYLTRAYLLSWAAGVSRLYWYAWDNAAMGLTEQDGKTVKEPGHAYGEIQNWIVGATMVSCQPDSQGTWTIELQRSKDDRGWIVWNPDRKVNFEIPAEWRVARARTLNGAEALDHKTSVEAGPMPVLLERGTR